MSFERFGLSTEILRAVADQGYSQPTPIQAKAIPVVLEGTDLLASAQTGTGKTASFTLPMLQRLSRRRSGRGKPIVRGLVLTPTRELAAQVGDNVKAYGKYLSLKSAVIFGGVNIQGQIRALRNGVDILVATPGRLLDHLQRGTLDVTGIEMLVLDEADRMLDMGFIHDIKKVLAYLPEKRQNLLFSATFSNEIKALANRLLDHPTSVEVARRNTASEQVEQLVHPVDRHRKREMLAHLIQRNDWRQVLVFTRTKHGANRLAQQLGRQNIDAAAIHGNKSQGARTKALAKFKSGQIRVLVATDIAARGLDIDKLPHVVNFELPNVPEDYVHRIGRTGRAGCEGIAVSLVCVDEHKLLRDIEGLLKVSITKETIRGFEPDASLAPEPIRQGRKPAAKRGHREGASGQNRSRNHGEPRKEKKRDESGEKPRGRVARDRQAKGNQQDPRTGQANEVPRKSGSRKRRRPPRLASSRPSPFSDI
ncbi:ATP-dependent RNA helicase RhlE [Sulfidibacter corallicola]|uniref:ATP-dependent RNA helicase RhlE n=1 Tax=Sulfidibacter corallicola TaxID=2818388 RepID=A0A8A4TXX0_SULCO|nr:DEAD/DEAH box helicase [Sulfidibacter corallicola]QTD53812.1 DEAD/DEAH box helicase [Sulfidibacter corallicola]